jgi:hypothetical protein
MIIQSNGILIVNALPVHIPTGTEAVFALDRVNNLFYIYNSISEVWDPVYINPVSDDAYNEAAWNGVDNLSPSQNAVRDILETIIAGVTPDGDYGNITVSGSGTIWTIDDNVVTYAKMQNISATDRILGRDTAGAGDPEELTVTGGLEFTGSGGIQRSALTGEVTAAAGNNATTIAINVVSNAKLADMPTDSLIGRDTAASGDPEYITLDDTLEFTGSGTIQRAALSGDVIASAGSNSVLIPNDTITYAKMQPVSATDRLLGRVTAGAGDVEEIPITDFAQTILAAVDEAALAALVDLEVGTDVQAWDATLDSLAAYNTNGLVTQTAANTFTGRTATGTANEITVTNGDGVAGNPTFSLPTIIDLGGKTSLEIPNGAAPTVNADGEIAVDTTVADFSHGLLKVFAGEELVVISVPIAEISGMSDGDVIKYNATADEFQISPEAAVVVPTLQQVLDSGSTLTSNETIATGANTLTISTATALSIPLTVTSDTGVGLFVSGAGIPISATTTGASPVINLTKNTATTNAVIPMIDISAGTTGTAANGLGGAINIAVEADNNSAISAGRIQAVTTDAVAASYTSKLEFQTNDSTVLGTKLEIAGNGGITLNEYGAGTFTGTEARSLNITAAGLVVEGAPQANKIYKAIINQTGVGTPTATVIANTLGEVPTFTRNGVGDYELNTVANVFTVNKTLVIHGQGASTGYVRSLARTAANQIDFTTQNSAEVALDLEGFFYISIEVYS